MYSGTQGDRQIRRNVGLPEGGLRPEIAPRPIVIITSENVASLVSYILEDEGHPTITANDIAGGTALAETHQACLIILDTDVLDQMPSTEQAVNRLVGNPIAPLLILTADSEPWSNLVRLSQTVRVVQKPLPTPALLSQIRAHMQTSGRTGELHFADVTASLRTRGVRRGARPVHTSPTQFRMLCHLLRYPGQVISREELVEAVWKRDTVIAPRSVDAHIVHLRKALTMGGERNIIQTVRSAGYLVGFDHLT